MEVFSNKPASEFNMNDLVNLVQELKTTENPMTLKIDSCRLKGSTNCIVVMVEEIEGENFLVIGD